MTKADGPISSKRFAALALAFVIWVAASDIVLPALLAPQNLSGGLFSFGARARLSIASLGLYPLLASFALMATLRLIAPPLDAWAMRRRAACNKLVLIGGLLIAAAQSYSVAVGLESAGLSHPDIANAVPINALGLVGGFLTMIALALWLDHFLPGDGAIFVLIFPWIVEFMGFANVFLLLRENLIGLSTALFLGACVIGAIFLIVFAQNARERAGINADNPYEMATPVIIASTVGLIVLNAVYPNRWAQYGAMAGCIAFAAWREWRRIQHHHTPAKKLKPVVALTFATQLIVGIALPEVSNIANSPTRFGGFQLILIVIALSRLANVGQDVSAAAIMRKARQRS